MRAGRGDPMLRILLLAVLGADPGPWGEAQVGGAGTYGSGNTTQTYTGLGSASVSTFLHRLVDDGTPLSLQPYLQRAGAISGSLSLSGFTTESPGFQVPYQGTTVGGTISLDAYPGELFSLWASASFSYAHAQGADLASSGTEWLLPRAEIGPGIRVDDTRMTIGYTWAPTITDGSYDGRGFGQLYLRVTTVIAQRLYLSALGELILSGGRGRLELAVFPSRVLGLGATIEYAKGALYYDSHAVYGQWQPSVSLSWWITWWLGLGLEYRFTHTEQVLGRGASVNSHRGAVTLTFRLD
jgi:hypothetical protein